MKVKHLVSVIFLFVCLISCSYETPLDNYKNEAKSEIVNYLSSLDYKDYEYDDWCAINSKVKDAMHLISNANNKQQIISTVNDVKKTIDNISISDYKVVEFNLIDLGGDISINNSFDNCAKIIKTREELNDFFYGRDIIWYKDTQYWNGNKKNIFDACDDNFFEDKALCVYIKLFYGSNIQRKIDDVFIKGDSLVIHMLGMTPISTNDDCFFLPFLIELDKKNIESIKCVYVIEQNKLQ